VACPGSSRGCPGKDCRQDEELIGRPCKGEIMAKQKIVCSLRLYVVLATFVFTFACSINNEDILYEGDDFTFSAPAGYKTKVYETPTFDPITNSEYLLFSNIGHYPYFLINRQKIPSESDLDTVFAEYLSIINGSTSSSYQFISQNTITINDRTAIEFVHREFIGEPYVQTRELWMEYNGWAYSLICVSPASARPGEVIPISEQCIRLAEGFQFK
jgi:hypothetical protein